MQLFQVVFNILEQDGWDFDFDDKNEVIRLSIQGIHSDYISYIMVDEEQESLLCNTQILRKIPYGKRAEICIFMNRVNYELAIGNFEMDMDDGLIRFRTYIDLANSNPSKDQLINLIWNGAQTFDTYYPGIISILDEDYLAEEAVELCMDE